MARSFAGLSVAVTGAGSGIGRATALAFAARGAGVVIGDIDGDRAAESASAVAKRGGAAFALKCDVRDDDGPSALVQAAVREFGRLDVLVNNAGIGHYGLVEDTPVDILRVLLETNVLGVHRGIRAALPVMRAQGSGHIVVVGSVNGTIAWPYHGAYSATKAALSALTQALRMELAGSGVTASLVLPVNVRTRFYPDAGVSTEGYRPRPLGPSASPAAVARAIVRSVERPSGEINQVRAFRIASTLAEAWPWLADAAGRRFYGRTLSGPEEPGVRG